MDYDRLQEILKSELPINRKERFYTGTVLPSLLFHGGLSNLYSFLHEIHGFPSEVNEQNTKDEFLFYTEYNLKESAGKKSVGTEIFTATRDTPDVIIQILKPLTVFIIIEAKMFAKPTPNGFSQQMQAQQVAVVDPLKQRYQGCHVFHIALVPRQLGFKDTSDYQVVNWEFFIDNKEINLQGNYFVSYLKFALENYSKLVSEQSGTASTVQGQLHGTAIYLDGKTDETLWVGRQGGRRAIEEDVRKGVWSNKIYGTNTEKPKDGREGNWLSSAEFAEIVDQVVIELESRGCKENSAPYNR